MFLWMLKIINKSCREIYRISHHYLWGKRLQINGIPHIVCIDKLQIGEDVSINEGCYLQCQGGVTIGNRVTLSKGSMVLTQGLDTNNYVSNSLNRYRRHITKAVYICDGVWLSANVIVCPGVFIGENCVIAAGAVVSESLVEPNCLYAGIPAKKVKNL